MTSTLGNGIIILPSILGKKEVFFTEKEEILKRSRQENDILDEREKYIRQKGADFSVGVLIFFWIVISRLAELDDAAQSAMGLLVHVTCFSNFAYQFTKNRTKTVVVFTVLFGASVLFYLAVFLKSNFKLF